MHRPIAISLICISLIGCVAIPAVSQTQIDECERTGICCVHHVSMKKKATSVRYGFIVAPRGNGGDIERSRFPFAQRHAYGGHALGPPWSAEIIVCDDCTAAKISWIQRHPHDPWADWWTEDLKEPNKALEPTTTSVTSPASAGAAPAVVVAHL